MVSNSAIFIKKNPCGFVTATFKTGITNPRGFFYLSNFYLVKLISDPLTLRPLCSSRFRSNKKCLVDQLLLGQNLLKNVLKGVKHFFKDFFLLLLSFFFHRNFTPEILTNQKSYIGKYYTGKYTYWKMLHRNFVTQELLYRNLSYTVKTNPEKVMPDK